MLNVKTSSLNVLMKDGKSVESEVNSKQDSLCKGSFTGNLNNCIDYGCFWCNFSNISNGPMNSGFGWLENISSSTGQVGVQKVFKYSQTLGLSVVYFRCYANGEFTPWRKLDTTAL